MKITTCYSVALKAQVTSDAPGKKKTANAFGGAMKIDGSLLRATADECLKAYRMCLDIFHREWEGIRRAGGSKQMKSFCERLIHSTNDNTASYPGFDEAHGYMPAFMRRSVMSDALGAVRAYMSLREAWKNTDPLERGDEPVLGCPDRYAMTFYEQDCQANLKMS